MGYVYKLNGHHPCKTLSYMSREIGYLCTKRPMPEKYVGVFIELQLVNMQEIVA